MHVKQRCECLWIKYVFLFVILLTVLGRKSTLDRIVTLMRKKATRRAMTSSHIHTFTHTCRCLDTPLQALYLQKFHPSFSVDKWVPLPWQGDKEQTGSDLRHKPQHENTVSALFIHTFAGWFHTLVLNMILYNRPWQRSAFLIKPLWSFNLFKQNTREQYKKNSSSATIIFTWVI